MMKANISSILMMKSDISIMILLYVLSLPVVATRLILLYLLHYCMMNQELFLTNKEINICIY